jgi:release factor glutamine methyltransferase
MNLADALNWGPIPRSERRLLLGHVLQKTHAFMAAHPEVELAATQQTHFEALVKRREAGEPIAYLLGEKEFYGRMFSVSPAVLIPRPETEILVDWVREKFSAQSAIGILDLGSGSGALAITLAAEYPQAKVAAVDISPEALDVARSNAQRLLNVHDQVKFLQGSWFAPLVPSQFDLIVSNPPYVASHDPHLAQGDVRFEPQGALVGGQDGMQDLIQIIGGASAYLKPGGWLLVEHGYDQQEAVAQLFRGAGFQGVECRFDLAGLPRISGGFSPVVTAQ